MSLIYKKQLAFFLVLSALIITSVSCNSKTEDTESDIVVTYSTVAIKSFTIQSNDSVMAHLDSVFFSIDLNTGVIFNADSLPKGTNVSRLIPVITFSNTMSVAELSFIKDNRTDTVVDYLKNPTDSIDFTYPVQLNVTAADGVNTFTYQIKLNVHNQEPDSLIWNKISYSKLPAVEENPIAQKTLYKQGAIYTMVEENNGEFSLWTTNDINDGIWRQLPFNPDFIPNIESFTNSSEQFYILSKNGNLYISKDLDNWEATTEVWISILGVYNNSVLGIRQEGNQYYHTEFPVPNNYKSSLIDEKFPITGYSSLGVIETAWASKPIAILAGGVTANGEVLSTIWAFDGNSWTILNEGVLPSMNNPMMVRYVVYRETTSLFVKREFDVWLVFGGFNGKDEINREVYMSYDNGVNWTLAPDLMQLSDKVPNLMDADVLVIYEPLNADLSEAWTPSEIPPTRTSYIIEGYDIFWMCPYMYIFGGYTNSLGTLNTDIYRGVLERLRFTPQI